MYKYSYSALTTRETKENDYNNLYYLQAHDKVVVRINWQSDTIEVIVIIVLPRENANKKRSDLLSLATSNINLHKHNTTTVKHPA